MGFFTLEHLLHAGTETRGFLHRETQTCVIGCVPGDIAKGRERHLGVTVPACIFRDHLDQPGADTLALHGRDDTQLRQMDIAVDQFCQGKTDRHAVAIISDPEKAVLEGALQIFQTARRVFIDLGHVDIEEDLAGIVLDHTTGLQVGQPGRADRDFIAFDRQDLTRHVHHPVFFGTAGAILCADAAKGKGTSMFNLATNLESAAAMWPDREAVIFQGVRLSYREIEKQASQVANGLIAAGIGRGDHVALVCPNRTEFVTAYYGILKIGATVVCVSALLRGREIAYQLDNSDAKAMIAYGGSDMDIGVAAQAAYRQVEACRHAWFITPGEGIELSGDVATFDDLTAGREESHLCAEASSEDTAVILYTSGTTGRPKGAELSHANIIMNILCITRVRPPDPSGGKTLIALPLFHVMAQTVSMHLGIYCAMTMVLLQRFDAGEVVRLLLDEGIVGFSGVPTMYRAILDSPDVSDADRERLKEQLLSLGAGGASLPADLQREVMRRFDVPMTNGYGATETSPASCFPQTLEGVPLGSIGSAGWGIDLRIVDDQNQDVPRGEAGELLVRGHCVMTGYYKDPEATAEAIRDGWYCTGDLARMDDAGFVYIAGRKKEMIIRGGFNVYPAEIEAVLQEHPDIGQAAVLGVPHPTHGEEVKAFVTPMPGQALDPEVIIAWSRVQMAAYKYPRLVEVRDSLPLGPTGKVLKRSLIEAEAQQEKEEEAAR